MIVEQALLHLPEILTGSGYPDHRYESSIVSAFSLALLQSLNGRNVPNPISCLQAERPFRGRQPWTGPDNHPRYLRADLNVRLFLMKVGSPALSSYGWRHDNWIEAKFFRGATPNKQVNTGALLADLLRLLTLVPSKRSKRDVDSEIVGRFLLHVYEGLSPENYLSIRRQTGGGSEKRKWLAPLVNSGRTKCPLINLGEYEADGILGQINNHLGDLRIRFEATSLSIAPILDLGDKFKQYTCILTRIDSFRVVRGNTRLWVDADRSVHESPDPATVTTEIREHVARWINTKESGIEARQPDEAEVEEEEEEDTE